MPILVHFKAKNNDNSFFYKNSGLSFQWVPYYVNAFTLYYHIEMLLLKDLDMILGFFAVSEEG